MKFNGEIGLARLARRMLSELLDGSTVSTLFILLLVQRSDTHEDVWD